MSWLATYWGYLVALLELAAGVGLGYRKRAKKRANAGAEDEDSVASIAQHCGVTRLQAQTALDDAQAAFWERIAGMKKEVRK